jgi:hypothetical protein
MNATAIETELPAMAQTIVTDGTYLLTTRALATRKKTFRTTDMPDGTLGANPGEPVGAFLLEMDDMKRSSEALQGTISKGRLSRHVEPRQILPRLMTMSLAKEE